MEVLRFIFLFFLMSLIIIIIERNKKTWKFLDRTVSFQFLREKHDDTTRMDNLTYQGQALWIFMLTFLIAIPFLVLSNNIFMNLALFTGFFLPGLMIFLRIKTFNDDNILKETGMGYDSLWCWLISFSSMFGFIVMGIASFSFINFPLYYSAIFLILGLTFGLLPIFPDYIDKFLSYDIRSKKGISNLFMIFVSSLLITLMIFILGLYIGF